MAQIFHIAFERDWAQALSGGSYRADSLTTEGFIHCSDRDQVVAVANRRFRGAQGLVLLRIDPDRVGAEIRYENLEGGAELFPHVYGPIPVDAVEAVQPFEPGAGGSFDHHAGDS